MATHQPRGRRIGELAERAKTSTDTIRYYERLGLLESPERTESGYRLYTEADLRRLQFVRRAKRLGFTLSDIRGLVQIAQDGQCQPLRQQVTDLLARKIEECELQLTELADFKTSLEGWYRVAQERLDEPACQCAAFPATCGCLPVPAVVSDLGDNVNAPIIAVLWELEDGVQVGYRCGCGSCQPTASIFRDDPRYERHDPRLAEGPCCCGRFFVVGHDAELHAASIAGQDEHARADPRGHTFAVHEVALPWGDVFPAVVADVRG